MESRSVVGLPGSSNKMAFSRFRIRITQVKGKVSYTKVLEETLSEPSRAFPLDGHLSTLHEEG